MNRQDRDTSGIPGRAIVIACLTFVAGCGAQATAPEPVDSVRLQLDFGGGVTLTSVNYTLTGPPGADGGADGGTVVKTGTLPVGTSDTITAMFGPLGAGKGYDVTVNGLASDGSSYCTGETMFNVPLPSPFVTIQLACSGRASVSADVNVCPTIDSLSVLPSEVYLGSSMQLSLLAHDADNGPAPLAITWSSTPGTLSNTSAMGATFTCTSVGTFTVSVSVDDGTPAMACVDSASVNVTCTALPGGM